MNVKKHLFALGLVAVMASPAVAADDILPPDANSPFSVTGNVALTSEYFFRGFSQSNDSPAVQGGLNLNYKIDDMFTATAGVWASSIDSGIGNGNVELDYLLGLAAAVTPDLTLNAGSTWFTYPGTNNAGSEPDWWEASVGATYNWGLFTTGVMYAYSPDFNLNSGDGHYLNGKVVVPLGYVDLSGAIGKQWVEKNAHSARRTISIGSSPPVRRFGGSISNLPISTPTSAKRSRTARRRPRRTVRSSSRSPRTSNTWFGCRRFAPAAANLPSGYLAALGGVR